MSQDAMFGAEEFRNHCAICHGATGVGDGPFTEYLTDRPTDLTTLKRNNGGEYPFFEVYQAIDGRKVVTGHATGIDEMMPIWGERYTSEAVPRLSHPVTGINVQEIVQARILSLVYYIQTLQKD